jgi:hypothetical protein
MAAGAANADAAQIRLVHAVPGAEPARLSVGGRSLGPSVGFGEVGRYSRAPDRRVKVTLVPGDGGKALAARTLRLGDARYTAVAAPSGNGVALRLYPDGAPQEGKVKVRAILAAGEIDAADLRVDGRTVARDLKRGGAGPYVGLEPGTYSLAFTRPGGRGGALVSRSGVELPAGTSSTAVVLGSGGEPTRIVLAPDRSAGPARGPDTGLGGTSEGPPWALALLAALVAGSLGVGAWRLARPR